MPKCPWYALTGWKCPGCGSQRMIHALLHGDLAAAWTHNAFLLCSLPLIAALGVIEADRRRWPRLYARLFRLPLYIAILLLLLAWTLLRNL